MYCCLVASANERQTLIDIIIVLRMCELKQAELTTGCMLEKCPILLGANNSVRVGSLRLIAAVVAECHCRLFVDN